MFCIVSNPISYIRIYEVLINVCAVFYHDTWYYKVSVPCPLVPRSPKCRQEYKQTECPTRYFCFCGKDEDPPFDPWLVPHSCGQVCGRGLKPDCGHSCLLLCHPGERSCLTISKIPINIFFTEDQLK